MKKVFVLLIIILLCILSACTWNEQTVEFKNKNFANTLFVQKVENNFTSEKLSKPIEDDEKIKKILTMIEGMKAEQINNEELINILENQDNYYMFGFYMDDKINNQRGDYAFQFLEDGTILFSYDAKSVDSYPLISVTHHQELLEDMKDVLGITF
ncbi:hypothetical protein MUN88_04100 [Gracilibacillus caseinilyticus]|uniref:Lipoprotein n=1 Tax=Gracilibacillus caseinilyticus TaxID=2932256 RepID=A0ABY4F4B8_9BACI|nr:hypothetical protein [Gracilibacillus caseinilyticus]UOQ49316.1 hypothetical protein MUN88_04100 [Gracilibacillus caseinilyticus]